MQLEHNSHESIYREPFGACPANTRVRLRLFAESSVCAKAVCVINNTEVPMHCAYSMAGGKMYECLVETPNNPGLLFYYFYVVCDGKKYFYANNDLSLGGIGKIYDEIPERLYQITVYEESYQTPDWMKNAVVYQIFPDRFFRGKDTPFHGIERKWGDEPFYTAAHFGGKYLSNDFFGGNFDGIQKKLPYLKDLGITAVYLNPISKAFSNHRYDTADYELPDETLGSVNDFETLCSEAKKLGIRIILDGVFSHTGADSRYFNKYGNFDSVGAYQSTDSLYYSWYSFKEFPEKYDSWWGFDTLPNVNELDDAYINYIAEGKNSVVHKWIKRGAGGFRLDVADELPDEFIRRFRTALKREDPDALLIGEVWEDASNKISYGERRGFLCGNELDSVMNYVFRDAVLSYLLDCNGALFSMRMNSLIENYPLPALYSAMNLISSHDVPRALTVLSGAPDFRTLSREAQHDYVIPEDLMHLAMRRMVLAICLQMTLPGAPTVYYGDETGMSGYADPFNRACMDWDKEGGILFMQTKIFTKLRNSNKCLRTGYYKTIYCKDSVIAYIRYNENGTDAFGEECTDDSVIVAVNPTDGCRQLELQLGSFAACGIKDALSGEKIASGSTACLMLEPLSYRLFIPERKNDICTKIQSI